MTAKDLIDYGYKPENCKIGVLYFKDYWFCILDEKNNVADFREDKNDMVSFGKATNIAELKQLEIKSLEKTIAKYQERIENLKLEIAFIKDN